MTTLLHMTLTGSVIILFVLLTRLFLRNAPKIYSYVLWAVVVFRLLCPVSFSSPVSLLGVLEAPVTVAQDTFSREKVPPQGADEGTPAVTPVPAPSSPTLSTNGASGMPRPTVSLSSILPALWLSGMAALFTYSVISLLLLRRRLLGAAPLEGNVYLADHIDSPFVMGLLHPRIYLPSGLSDKERGYILLHEQHHIRRLDHIWKLLGFLALCIHWFNPLVWLSFHFGCRDMEMSCDEAVLKKMGAEIRADYSASLLRLATGRPIIAGTPLAFGEGDTKHRIKNALRWRTPPVWVRVVAALFCGLVIAFCAGDPMEEPPDIPAVPPSASVGGGLPDSPPTLADVEAIFVSEKPGAAILDSVLAYDGAYGTIGVVLYTEDPYSQHLAYVMEEGWCYPVGLGSEEVPLTAVSDPQLTYLGNGTVTWLCEQNGVPLRYNIDFSLTDGHAAFRPTSTAVKTALDIGIDEALRSAFFHNNTINACACVSHVVLDTKLLCVDAAMGASPAGGMYTIVDLLALGMDFHMVDGALTPIRERAIEMTLTFEEDGNGGYTLLETAQEETDLGDYDLSLRQECYEQASAYFGIDMDK